MISSNDNERPVNCTSKQAVRRHAYEWTHALLAIKKTFQSRIVVLFYLYSVGGITRTSVLNIQLLHVVPTFLI